MSVSIPASPPAPASFELDYNDSVAMSVSPFTGKQQVQRWGASPRKLRVTFLIKSTDAANWKTFLENLQGSTNTFQFSAAFAAAYPEVGTRNWRMRSNNATLSIGHDRLYSLPMDLIEDV